MTSDDLDPVDVEERALVRSLRQLAEETAHEQASPHVEAALIAAFRTKSWSRPRAGVQTWWLRAAAVLVMMAGGLWWFSASPEQQPADPEIARASSTASGDAFGDELRDDLRNDLRNDIVTSFVPLPYGGGTAYLESAHIVRMELPRSALVTLGLAVPEEQWTERMQADVLFGEDGLARGIRFVKLGTEN